MFKDIYLFKTACDKIIGYAYAVDFKQNGFHAFGEDTTKISIFISEDYRRKSIAKYFLSHFGAKYDHHFRIVHRLNIIEEAWSSVNIKPFVVNR